MAHIYKIELRFNLASISTAENSLTWRDANPFPYSDSAVLDHSTTWAAAIWSPLRNHIDSQVVLMSARVIELVAATGDLLRIVGSISPVVNGNLGNQALPWVDTLSFFARTAIPRVKGQKGIAGITEAGQEDGLFNNTVLAAGAAAATAWVNGPVAAFADGGVWSAKQSDFVPFSGTGGVTNVPGTRVTRRPGRGS